MKNMNTEYKMGLGLPRGSKVIVKAGNRQADIRLVELEDGGHNWKLQIDRDLPRNGISDSRKCDPFRTNFI